MQKLVSWSELEGHEQVTDIISHRLTSVFNMCIFIRSAPLCNEKEPEIWKQ